MILFLGFKFRTFPMVIPFLWTSLQIRLVEGKILPAVLCLMRQNRHSVLAFPKFRRKCLLGIRGKSTAGVILPLGESGCLDWSSDKNDRLGLALGPCYMT